MGRLAKLLARLRRDEAGLTLVELLIAASLGLVVVGGALMLLTTTIRSEPRATSKVAAIQQARVATERITREIRLAKEAPAATATQLSIVTLVRAATCGGAPATTPIPCRVTYSCDGTACTRAVGPANGSTAGTARPLVTGLASPNVFSYLPDAADPYFVGVTFSLSSSDGAPVTVGDGAGFRNQATEEGA